MCVLLAIYSVVIIYRHSRPPPAPSLLKLVQNCNCKNASGVATGCVSQNEDMKNSVFGSLKEKRNVPVNFFFYFLFFATALIKLFFFKIQCKLVIRIQVGHKEKQLLSVCHKGKKEKLQQRIV